MNEIQKHISFGVGRKNQEKVEHELFDDPILTPIGVCMADDREKDPYKD